MYVRSSVGVIPLSTRRGKPPSPPPPLTPNPPLPPPFKGGEGGGGGEGTLRDECVPHSVGGGACAPHTHV